MKSVTEKAGVAAGARKSAGGATGGDAEQMPTSRHDNIVSFMMFVRDVCGPLRRLEYSNPSIREVLLLDPITAIPR